MSAPRPSNQRQLMVFQMVGAPVAAGLILGVAVAVVIGGGVPIVLIFIGLGVIAAAVIFGRRIWDDSTLAPGKSEPAPGRSAADPDAPTDEHPQVARDAQPSLVERAVRAVRNRRQRARSRRRAHRRW